MDEALYVPSAAVFLLHGQGTPPFVHDPACWVTVFGRRLPLMIIPYVGAVKAYAALPLFVAFGANAETSGSPASSSALSESPVSSRSIGTQAGTRSRADRRSLLAIHPSYLELTVFDNGGVSVWMAGMGLVALALTFHLRRGTAFLGFRPGPRGRNRRVGGAPT